MKRALLLTFPALLVLAVWGCAGDGTRLTSCGDGIVDGMEECDDGNTMSGDGCDENCEIEIPPDNCGDGNVDPGEECDDGNNINGDGCDEDCNVEMNTLTWIQDNIFTPVCVECHFPGGPGPMPLTDEQTSFDNLVNVTSVEVPPTLRVAPFDAENSYLVHKVEGRAGIVGQRMPIPPRPMLTPEEIQAIIDWIDAGAER